MLMPFLFVPAYAVALGNVVIGSVPCVFCINFTKTLQTMSDLYYYNQAGEKVSVTVDRMKTLARLGLIVAGDRGHGNYRRAVP